MKKVKRWISCLLVFCLIASMVPVTAHAATYSGTCGENLTWVLDENGVLTISGTGPMTDYYNSSPWSGNRSSITSAIIEDGVTSIGSRAFYECSKLVSVTIPDGVINIGEYAFDYCRNLSSVTIPDSVMTIGEKAFYGCDRLTGVTIPNSVTSIGEEAFSRCSSLSKIYVDENNPYYSSDVCGVLLDKEKNTLIQAPGAISGHYTTPDSVTNIETEAFYECESLETDSNSFLYQIVRCPVINFADGYVLTAYFDRRNLSIQCNEELKSIHLH